jgi:hypothetical protein
LFDTDSFSVRLVPLPSLFVIDEQIFQLRLLFASLRPRAFGIPRLFTKMKLFSAFAFLAALSSTIAAPASDIVPNQYIVKFKAVADCKLFQKFPATLTDHLLTLGNPTHFYRNQWIDEFTALTRSDVLTSRLGKQGRLVEIGSDFTGFVGKLSETAAQELRSHPQVEFVEPNRIIRVDPIETKPIEDGELPEELASLVQTENLSWGLDRLDQRDLPLDGKYDFPENAGEGVLAYVIDTGILPTHSEFEDRAIVGPSFARTPEDEKRDSAPLPVDTHGHGTHGMHSFLLFSLGLSPWRKID